jgi:hypothetical protein
LYFDRGRESPIPSRTTLGFAPAATIYWFKSGPLAWNGIIPFWLPIGVFFIWMIVNTAVVRSAILRQGAVTPSTA